MWMMVAVGWTLALVLLIVLENAKVRERRLIAELGQAESNVREAQAAALNANAQSQQAHAQARHAHAEAEQAQAQAHYAHAEAQRARAEAHQADMRAEQARTQAEHADTRAQHADTQASQDRAAAEQANAHAQQAQAEVRALVDVEQRYRGVMDLEGAIGKLQTHRIAHRQELDRLVAEVDRLRHQLAALTDEEYFVDFGIYSTRYDFPTSESYKGALEAIRARQKGAVKAGTAAVCHVPWTVEGSVTKGRKMTNDNLKMMIRAFNGECDAAITKVTYKNIGAIEQRIWKAKEQLDRLNGVNRCELTQAYAGLKVEELRLFYEYEVKREEERQEQREIREQIREEKQAQQELEKARKQAEDEELRYVTALAKAREEALQAVGAKQAKMTDKIAELEARLLEAQSNKERAISQAQLTRAGHVYVISNVGSFGEEVYKIGMTRRLEPMDRVKELGDASVPFAFDVHAIIRSQDAPTLERELHRRFAARRVNLVNERKEFFMITLQEIHVAVTELHGEIELTRMAEAADYRQSVALRQERARSGGGLASAPPAPPAGMVHHAAAPEAARGAARR